MRFMISKPYPDIPKRRWRYFHPWAIRVDFPQQMRSDLRKWVLIIGLMLISRYVFSAGLEVEPTSHDFGDVLVNTTSAGQTFNLLNKEGNLLQIGKIEPLTTVVDEFGNVTTVPSTEFIISNDACSNSQLGVIPSPSATCKFIAAFKPQSLGTKTSVLLIPYSNGQMASELTIPLIGNSVNTLIPNIQVEPLAYDFKDIQIGSVSDYQTLKVSNTSGGSLQIGKIKFSGDKDFIILYDFCSNQKVSQSQHCSIITRFEPKKVGTKTATLSIPSNDPDTPTVTVTLNGNGILGCSKKFSFSPNPVDFGTEVIGDQPMNLNLRINAKTKGCDVKIEENFTITGTNAAKFSIKKEKCSHKAHKNAFYSHCSLTLAFSPTSEGIKQAELLVTFSDATKETIPLVANAVKTCQAALDISPTSYDFGTVAIGLDRQQQLTLSNPSSCNVQVDTIEISGRDKIDFKARKCRNKTLRPSQTCVIDTFFMPQLGGEKQANLSVTSEVPPVIITASLMGKGYDPTDCSKENITIESTMSGIWAEKGNDQKYDQPSSVWKRLKNLRAGERDTPNRPNENDVVLIKAGHNITAIPDQIQILTLCIEESGMLESWNNQGTNLELRASRYIENKGLIQGRNGVNEVNNEAALPGANIVLSVGTLLRNEGSILSGHGGSGKQFGAAGGNINIWASDIVNTNDIGIIDAGRGGDITGIQSGQAGRGGNITLRGGNSLTSDGRRILAGNGGNCNPMAVQPQTGGDGGDMLFNANRVNLLAGTFAAGEGGKNCGPLGTDGSNGRSGRLNMDPGAITLSGINTQIKGGDITLFGGNDWVLDLSNLGEGAITATSNITLAVGEGGAIDMRGSANKFLKAAAKVIIFADDIILDENKTLDDLIEANDIIIGPSQILYDVSLTAPNTVSGEPNSILPIRLMLSNDGPEKDIYWLNLTDTASWPLSQLPLTVEIEGLETIELVLNVTLPSTQGAKNTITITAISQSDPMVIATKEILISVSATGNSSTEVIPPPQPLSSCASNNGIIDWVCRNNSDQVLTDITVESKGNVAGGILAGNTTNRGIISQVKVQSGAVVNGGKLTGYINNEGTLANFEFVGAQISGGTLAGMVSNNSKVDGTFRDVHLAADAHIIGGYLQGNIIGDMNAPALLENVTIKSDSFLSGVKLGEGVMLEAKATCGDGVQADQGVCPSDIELPPLRATATNAQGENVGTAAIFSGGISVNQVPFETQATLTIADLVDILGQIQVDPLDLGQAAELVVYVSYKPLAARFSDPPVYFMLNENGDILPWNKDTNNWDEDVKNLVAFQTVDALAPYLPVSMYQGPLPATGHLKIFFGYRLVTGGTVIQNLEPIEVTITE